MNLRNINYKKLLIICILFTTVGILSVLPAFYGGYLKVTFDGNVHLSRFESIYKAISAMKVPSSVNFIGFNGMVAAYNSFYPWLTGLLFIMPRFIINNQLHAWMAGFFVVNFLTMVNMFILSKKLTNNFSLQLLGTFIYQLSAYHFTLLYSRMALGEALAYTFLPLVFTGLLNIWADNNIGILFLGIGMGLIINSHILSALITTIILAVIFMFRCVLKMCSLKEIRRYIYSALISIITSSYTLLSFFSVYVNNKVETPFHLLQAIVASDVWIAMLNNSIKDTSSIFNIGLIETLLLVILAVPAFISKYSKWKLWWMGSIGIGILTLNWLPWNSQYLVDSPIGSIQFLGRLLTYVVLFLAISVVMFLDKIYGQKFSMSNLIVLVVPLLAMGMCATYNYHITKKDDPIRFYPHTNHDFNEVAYHKFSVFDYQLKNNGGHSRIPIKEYSVYDTKQKYNQISIKITSSKARKYKFNIPIYIGVKYTVKVNGVERNIVPGRMLIAHLREGKNTITITSNPTKLQSIALIISIISIILGTSYSFYSEVRKSNVKNIGAI